MVSRFKDQVHFVWSVLRGSKLAHKRKKKKSMGKSKQFTSELGYNPGQKKENLVEEIKRI